jgi:uncharacterized protein
MNKDIAVMVELQAFWDNVLKGRSESARCGVSITHWEKGVRDKNDEVSARELEIKNMKALIKDREINLTQKDEQSKKLESRKGMLKNEKEITALEHELKTINEERGILEEELIVGMDGLQSKERELVLVKAELEKITAQANADIEMLKKKISGHNEFSSKNESDFNVRLKDLAVPLQSKFVKILNQKNGIAISAIENDKCGGCNFMIPVYLSMDAARDVKIINCSNCGRFIFRRA